MQELGPCPAHLEAKLPSELDKDLQSNCAEKDGVISIQQVGQTVAGKQHCGNLPANPRHQMVNDAIEEMGSSHAALVKATGDGEAVRAVRVCAADADTGLCVW